LTGHLSILPVENLEGEERLLDLDDPFIGLLGQKTGRDELWLGKAVPRYTSYPPATAFREDFTPEMYKTALQRLSPEQPVSLYLHVPFCQALCLYCGCNTCATQQHDRITNYMGFALREIENIALSAERERKISHLHFGGGSPNILSEKDFGLLFGSLARRFDMSGCGEIAMELDPRLVTKAQAKILGMLGVTRVSLGVQDFDPKVQQAVGRKQSYELVKAACNELREAGVRHICFDLMYGLPFQSPASLAETARDAVSLRPNRIALFSYAHVPQVKKHQRALEQYLLPGPHACVAMESAARHVLRQAGYVEIGMDHFALPADPLSLAAVEGRLQRNFQGYTDDKAASLLGVGASSIGHMPGVYYQNARATEDYEERIRAYGFATSRGLVLTGEDRLRAAVIESLMCHMAVNLEKLCRQFNFALSAFTEELEALRPFEDAGLVRRSGYKIFLTTPYRMAVRVIASLFDKTARQADAPVSRAV
jgi:oxygen-independent coproporphyrinogen-3 oxidase